MKIRLIMVGKTTEKYTQAGIEEYTSRLSHYCRLEVVVIPELKNAKSLSEQQIKEAEGRLILGQIGGSASHVVLLDSGGMQPTSEGLADWLEGLQNRGLQSLVFVVGGAYGFSREVYDRAAEKLSLSRLTFSHQMVRVIFLEQLYRAHTILRGQPYHHS